MLEILMPVAAFLTQFFSEKFLEWGLDRIHLAKVKEKLDLIIQVVLQESIADFSDGTYIIENFDFIGYFQDPIVQGELSLFVRPSDDREPDVKVLQNIWERKLGSQVPGNYQLILEKFLRSLKQRIWEIKEIQPLLHYKETKVFQKDVRSQLEILISSLPSDDKNLNDDIEFLDYKSRQVLAGINYQLSNGVEIDRMGLDEEFDKKFDKSPLIIIKGDAGAGKSAFAKRTILRLQKPDCIILAFKADVFTKDSLNELFPDSHNSFTKILDYLCRHNNIVLMIDSLEKLLEVDNYDALKELFRTCKDSANIKIVITCRSFAYAQLIFDLHGNLPQHDFLEIPYLDEAELDQAEKQFPLLANLFKKKSLRHLLRKPFYLNLLVTHSEITNNADFISEKDFRNLIWDKVIAKGDLYRSETFRTIAVQRAIAMSLFTRIEKPNPDAIKGLVADGIILADEKLGELYCPSHDIFEDIALIRYVEQIYQGNSDVSDFFAKLGGKEPAIRRAFRLWLNDQLYNASSTFSNFIANILGDLKIDQYWKDETIISILNSNYSKIYFDSNIDVLKENDWALFVRFIHILRTTCQEPDEQLAKQLKEDNKKENNYWLYLKPVGLGWKAVIEFIHDNFEELGNHKNLIFGLIVKDWSKRLGVESDLPPESVSAGKILFSIFHDIENEYGSLSQKDINDGIVVLFKLCSRFPNEIHSLIQAANSYDPLSSKGKANYNLRNFYRSLIEHTLSGLYSKVVCQEFPELVCEVAIKAWLKHEEQSNRLGGIKDIGDSFGLAHGVNHGYFPAGIYQTPIRFLLYYHPSNALRLIVRVMNFSTEAYANSRRGKENGVVRVEICDDNGLVSYQLGDAVLWGMYRGFVQSTPYLLQSMLMALENWLLELCEIEQDWVDKLIKSSYSYLLKNSTSVATTAVLASVAMAYPEKIEKACFPILKVREFYEWDVPRLVGDQHPLAPYDQNIPFAQKERHKSNQLRHRNDHLEILVTKLQIDGYWNEINAILDGFQAAVEPDDKRWKLALNRMDFRKYKADENAKAQEKNQVLYRPEIDDDLTPYVEEGQKHIAITNKALSVTNWASKVFEGNKGLDTSIEVWRDEHKKYLELISVDNDLDIKLYANPAYLAAVGIRDFVKVLNQEEKLWCISIVLEVIQECVIGKIRHDYFSPTKYSPLALGPSIQSIPLILSMKVSDDIIKEAKITIFLALLYLAEDKGENIFEVVRKLLWEIDHKFAESCFAGILEFAKLITQERMASYRRDVEESEVEGEFYEKVLKLADLVCDGKINADISHLSFDTHSHWHLGCAVQMLPLKTNNDTFRSYVESLFMLLFQALNTRDDDYQRNSSDYITTEFELRDYLAEYLLNQDVLYSQKFFSNILDQVFDAEERVERSAEKFVEKIIEHLIVVEDRINVPAFWDLLIVLEKKIKQTQKPRFVQYLFLSIPWWSVDTEDWIPLKNKKQYLRNLIMTVGQFDIKSVVRLLSGIGTKSLLPDGLVWLEAALASSPDSVQELTDSDTFFYSEKLIQRVYNLYLRNVKSNSEIKRSFLFLLDTMIDAGSSLAFIIRERVVSI